jgi:signal transduction histidine kinase
VEDIINETRSLTFRIGNPILYDFGVSAALEALADDIFRPVGIECNIMDNCPELSVKENMRPLLYRMYSELCYNIVKHSNATKVDIKFYHVGNYLYGRVEDNGVGFKYNEDSGERKHGLGLFGIRERLKYLGGTMKITTAPGKGTRIVIGILNPDEEKEA